MDPQDNPPPAHTTSRLLADAIRSVCVRSICLAHGYNTSQSTSKPDILKPKQKINVQAARELKEMKEPHLTTEMPGEKIRNTAFHDNPHNKLVKVII